MLNPSCRSHEIFRLALLAVIVLTTTPLFGQSPAARRRQMEEQQKIQQQLQKIAENQPKLPADAKLLSLHREFITSAEKLGAEYEGKKQYDRAREVYESLMRLVPKYDKAEAGLQRVLTAQSLQDSRLTKVFANKAWQDTGVTLQQDMPVVIEVKGEWSVALTTGPEGIRIPNEMKPKNSQIVLGTLIGMIVSSPQDLENPKPFIVKPEMKFTAEKTGRLYLRMFDIEPADNEGQMFVRIQSTFAN
ncbi:MAG: hypothetical protein WBD20_04035 [Pirellulaceae bacterium]